MIAYVNGSFLEEEKAVLHVGDLAFQRGYAAFDYLRTKNKVLLFLDDYLTRFYRSAEQMHLQPTQTIKELKEIIGELIQKNQIPHSGIRMILTGGYSADGYSLATPNLVILQQAIQMPSIEKFKAGVKIITHEYSRDLPSVKSINYLMGIWLQQKVAEHNAADVLYHSRGWVSEFPRANVFIVTKEGTIVTPAEGILHGITRMKLINLTQGAYALEERAVSLEEVKEAAEVFMTSTTKRLLPVNQVDDIIIGKGKAGPITTLLNKMFLDMENTLAQVQELA